MDENSPLRYDLWIEDALRTVIRRTLTYAQTKGLPGEHHFYITFRTADEGVSIPDFLFADHPEEMTIILQHQFDDLSVDEHTFRVTLRFNGKPAKMIIPLASIISFADPSVNFGLQLKMTTLDDEDTEMDFEYPLDNATASETAERKEEEPVLGEVIALDAFRKKT